MIVALPAKPFITQLFYVTTSCSVCQELFQVFENFFVAAAFRSFPSVAQLDYIITDLFVCQELFSIFSNFFLLFRRPRGQLAYTSTALSFCQALFREFRHFLSFSFIVYIFRFFSLLFLGIRGPWAPIRSPKRIAAPEGSSGAAVILY